MAAVAGQLLFLPHRKHPVGCPGKDFCLTALDSIKALVYPSSA